MSFSGANFPLGYFPFIPIPSVGDIPQIIPSKTPDKFDAIKTNTAFSNIQLNYPIVAPMNLLRGHELPNLNWDIQHGTNEMMNKIWNISPDGTGEKLYAPTSITTARAMDNFELPEASIPWTCMTKSPLLFPLPFIISSDGKTNDHLPPFEFVLPQFSITNPMEGHNSKEPFAEEKVSTPTKPTPADPPADVSNPTQSTFCIFFYCDLLLFIVNIDRLKKKYTYLNYVVGLCCETYYSRSRDAKKVHLSLLQQDLQATTRFD
ncbi:hypothetical protein RFI_02471 [Reticulomyxa filosa]|uniref:Uncharacterized protein n=1 Tax=Reticulomyxa filosa TaxID=46433 RepID=X6P977_RETFI|nr:hypothetical protein RFI_02471 [Reticulomyxa filosa]|eukprot:ETO34619.1 hypothetical protein RFI_02471 [Reticulomyxa filosa]